MFVDAVWANVLVFAVGQAAAWLYLRSGRFLVGAGATVLLWAAMDWWLVGRYLLATPADAQRVPLLLLQVTALATVVAYVAAQVRRRRGRASRTQRHREALQRLLAGDATGAAKAFGALTWTDPWDVAAWTGLGDAQRRAGLRRKARASYRRAAAVDTARGFADLLAHRLVLLERVVATDVTGSNGDRAGATAGTKPAVVSKRDRARTKARSAG